MAHVSDWMIGQLPPIDWRGWLCTYPLYRRIPKELEKKCVWLVIGRYIRRNVVENHYHKIIAQCVSYPWTRLAHP